MLLLQNRWLRRRLLRLLLSVLLGLPHESKLRSKCCGICRSAGSSCVSSRKRLSEGLLFLFHCSWGFGGRLS